MGEDILVCDVCGKILQGEAFATGGAYIVQDLPYCAPCRPLREVQKRRTAPPDIDTSLRAKLLPVLKFLATPTGVLLIVGSSIAGSILIVVWSLLGTAQSIASNSDAQAAVETAAIPAPSAPPTPEAERFILDLERRAAASYDPDEILRWCEEARSRLQETSFETRRRGIEVRARESKARRATDLEPLLVEIRKALGERPIEGQRPDVEVLLAAAMRVAGSRQPEVVILQEEYERKIAEVWNRVGLVGRWTFEEASGLIVVDATGRGNNGLLPRGVMRVPDGSGRAIRFAGSPAAVELPATTQFDSLADGSFTLSAWYRPETLPSEADHAILTRDVPGIGLRYAIDGRFVMRHLLEGDLQASAATPDPWPPRHWYHLVGVVDLKGGVNRIYVNGFPRWTVFFSPGTPGRTPEKPCWKIGEGANGTIDDVRIYHRALTANDVRSLYDERPPR